MSLNQLRRALLVISLGLATLAGCNDTDTTAPDLRSHPVFAQGDNGVWTVNSLLDPGNGTCDDAECTLREAVSAASSGGQIVFVSGLQGTIDLFARLSISKNLTIDGNSRITLDAADDFNVMDIINVSGSPAMIVTLDGLTMKNGDGLSAGGTLWISGINTVTIRNSTISGSTATGDGGAIWVHQATSLTLLNSTISGNSATGDGGGIWTDGTVTIRNSTIHGNNATQPGSEGGGIYNSGTLVIEGSTLSNNNAEDGGGIFNHQPGGLTLKRSTLSGNTARRPSSFPVGGGITTDGFITLSSSTITRNGDLGLLVIGATATISNTIIAGNASDCVVATGGSVVSLGYNIRDLNSGACTFASAGDVLVSPALVFSQLLEQTLADNGGPTKTHALIVRGLGVDRGYCPGETIDQRGFARPADEPTLPNAKDGCDIGAYEAQGPQVVVADLMVSQTVDKNSVKQGELLTYTVRVQNLGPQTAPNVVLNNVLSSGVTFFAARQNTGTIIAPPRGETGTVTWNIGDMVDQANEFAEIQVTVLVRGKTTITNTATVSGNVADPNPANDSAAITVTVAPGKSGGKG